MTARTKKAVNSLAYSSDITSTSFQSLGIGMSYVFSNCTSNRIQFGGNSKCNGRFEKQWFGSRQGFGKTGRLVSNALNKHFVNWGKAKSWYNNLKMINVFTEVIACIIKSTKASLNRT